MKHNKRIFRKSAAISAATLSVLVLPSAIHADPVTLENETFRITIDPAKGAHCTEFIIKEFGKQSSTQAGIFLTATCQEVIAMNKIRRNIYHQ